MKSKVDSALYTSEIDGAGIAARLDRLPSSHVVWKIVIFVSLGGIFEFYDLFLTGYVAPDMIKAGLFSQASIGPFATLQQISVSGAGTFLFCTFAGFWTGLLVFGRLADMFGRRAVFTWSLLWNVAGTFMTALQPTGETLNIWRFVAAIGFGVQLVTIDTYIAEIVPPEMRGRAFALNQFITFSIVPVVALLAWVLSPLRLLGLEGWRWVMLIGSVGAIAVWPLRAAIPESPRWLAVKGRVVEADTIVLVLERAVEAQTGRTLSPPKRATPEALGRGHLWELVSPRYVERTIMLCIVNLAQVIGFYGFAAWVPTLLVARGINLTHSLQYSFFIAMADPLGPLLAASFADRLERKFQVILGLLCMALFMALFSTATSPARLIALGVLFTLSANIMSYAFHSYQVELYPTRIRARAVSFVYSWSRLAAAFAGLAIGYFLHAGGVPAVAVFVAGAMLAAMVMIGVFGPYTGGRPLEQINH